MFPEYAEYLDYIHDEIKPAFTYLVDASSRLADYEAMPAPHGYITRNCHYFKEGRSDFAFTVNRKWLLFYLAFPRGTRPDLTITRLQKEFADVKELKSGTINFKIRTEAEARSAMRIVFGVD